MRCGGVFVATEEPSQEAMVFFLGSRKTIGTTTDRAKGLRPGILVGILLPLFYLLPERLSLLLVGKRQTGKAVLEFAASLVSRHGRQQGQRMARQTRYRRRSCPGCTKRRRKSLDPK